MSVSLHLYFFPYICSHTCLPWVAPSAVCAFCSITPSLLILEHNHMLKDWWKKRSGILAQGGQKVWPQILLITLKLSDTNESRHVVVCMNRRNSENDMQPSVQMKGDIFTKWAQRGSDSLPGVYLWKLFGSSISQSLQVRIHAASCADVNSPQQECWMWHLTSCQHVWGMIGGDGHSFNERCACAVLKCSYHNTGSVLGQQGGGFESHFSLLETKKRVHRMTTELLST